MDIALSVLYQWVGRTRSLLYITATRLRLVFVHLILYNAAVHAVFITYKFPWTCMNVLIKYEIFSNTSKHRSVLYYVFLILPFYDNEMYSWVLEIQVSYLNTTVLVLCLILQKKSLVDGILLFYQLHLHICCECILLFLRNMFKFLGHTQFLEVYTASKEIMLFHDHGFVLFRFACGFN
jgi:hypothetical protein